MQTVPSMIKHDSFKRLHAPLDQVDCEVHRPLQGIACMVGSEQGRCDQPDQFTPIRRFEEPLELVCQVAAQIAVEEKVDGEAEDKEKAERLDGVVVFK